MQIWRLTLQAVGAVAAFPLYFILGKPMMFKPWNPWAAYLFSLYLVTATVFMMHKFGALFSMFTWIFMLIITPVFLLVQLQRSWHRHDLCEFTKCVVMYWERYPLSGQSFRVLLAVVANIGAIFTYALVACMRNMYADWEKMKSYEIFIESSVRVQGPLQALPIVFPHMVLGRLSSDLRHDVVRAVSRTDDKLDASNGIRRCEEWRELRVRRQHLRDLFARISSLNGPYTLFFVSHMAIFSCLEWNQVFENGLTASVVPALLRLWDLATVHIAVAWSGNAITSLGQPAEALMPKLQGRSRTMLGNSIRREVLRFVNDATEVKCDVMGLFYLDLNHWKSTFAAISYYIFVFDQLGIRY